MFKRTNALKSLAGALALGAISLTGCGGSPVAAPYAGSSSLSTPPTSGYGTTTGAYGSTTGSPYGTSAGAYGSTTASPYGATAGAYGATTSPYGATASAYGGTTGSYGATASPYGSAMGVTPQLQANLSVTSKGFLFFTHAKVSITVTNPSSMALTGTLTVTWTEKGNPTSSIQTQQVSIAANGTQTIALTAPILRSDGATCTVSTDPVAAASGYGAAGAYGSTTASPYGATSAYPSTTASTPY